MRLGCLLFFGIAWLSNGCAAPTIMAFSGNEWVPLGTRDQVHEALGTPTKVDVSEGKSFEEFPIRNGCEQIVMGCRVQAFQPLEEFHVKGWSDLQLMAVDDVGSMPARSRNLIVVANVHNELYFRIFDEEGHAVVDTSEKNLRSKSRLISDFKVQLENLWPPRKLSEEEKHRIIATIVSIVGRNPLGSFDVGVGNVKTYGLVHIGTLPNSSDRDRQRVIPGQILRFEFDHLGNARKVFVDDELLFSIAPNLDLLVPGLATGVQR